MTIYCSDSTEVRFTVLNCGRRKHFILVLALLVTIKHPQKTKLKEKVYLFQFFFLSRRLWWIISANFFMIRKKNVGKKEGEYNRKTEIGKSEKREKKEKRKAGGRENQGCNKTQLKRGGCKEQFPLTRLASVACIPSPQCYNLYLWPLVACLS